MASPQDIKEILVELAFLAMPDEFVHPNANATDLVETMFEFDPDGLPSHESGDSGFHDSCLTTASITAFELCGDDTGKEAFLRNILNSPPLHIEVVELLDEELKVVYPMYADPKYTFGEKATAVAKGRLGATQSLFDARIESRKGQQNTYFKVILYNFVIDRKNEFLREKNLRICFDDSFDFFQDALKFGTSFRALPPPPPYPDFEPFLPGWDNPTQGGGPGVIGNEETGDTRSVRSDSVNSSDTHSTWSETTDRPTLEYSELVLSRSKEDKGYSLNDGPWIYRIQEVDGIGYGPQHLLAGSEEFTKMVDALKTLLKRNPDDQLVVKMIHSQDRVGRAKWMEQARKNKIENAARKREEDEMIDNAEFELAVEKLGEGMEPIEGLYEDFLRN